MLSSSFDTHHGRAVTDLRAYFNRVTEGMTNWKLPISWEVTAADIALAITAIEFFVGGDTSCEVIETGRRFRLRNAGYFANIGA